MVSAKFGATAVKAQGQLILTPEPAGLWQLPWFALGKDEAADLPAQCLIKSLLGWRVEIEEIRPAQTVGSGLVDLVIATFDSDRPVNGQLSEDDVRRCFSSGLTDVAVQDDWRPVIARVFD